MPPCPASGSAGCRRERNVVCGFYPPEPPGVDQDWVRRRGSEHTESSQRCPFNSNLIEWLLKGTGTGTGLGSGSEARMLNPNPNPGEAQQPRVASGRRAGPGASLSVTLTEPTGLVMARVRGEGHRPRAAGTRPPFGTGWMRCFGHRRAGQPGS